MKRISTNLPNNDMQYHLRRREAGMNSLQNKLAGQTRIPELRDDPAAAGHSSRYASLGHRFERYIRNVEYAQANHRITEGRVNEAVEIVQRVRELAVQAANGTYSKQDLSLMGEEVNQLLNQLVDVGNARNADGTSIFAGDKSHSLPFRAVEGTVDGNGTRVITNVEYIGSIGVNKTEISDGAYARLNFPGNQVFWAEIQQIYSTAEASTFQVDRDVSIFIDGEEIPLKGGDTVHAVIARINDSNAPVKARLDPVRGSLVIEATTPHQLWLQDAEDGNVLQSLGILRDGDSPPPDNISHTARSFGGSAFDMLIKLRDDLFQGKTFEIGGRDLVGMDNALSSLSSALGALGAQGQRLEITQARLETEAYNIASIDSLSSDLDTTKAIMDLKMLEHTHRAALSVAARILQPTLLDFLR